MPHTVGSIAHVQYTVSWKNVLGVLESPGIFSMQENGNPGWKAQDTFEQLHIMQ